MEVESKQQVDRESHQIDNGVPPSMKKAASVRFQPASGDKTNQNNRRDRLRKSMSKRFSVLLSTEDMNQTDEKVFYGPYQHLKKQLDYGYHSYYRMDRQWVHDSIIEDYMCHDEQSKHCAPAEPWLIYTCGVKGAGKRHMMNQLMEDGRLPLLSTIIVDADEIRRSLPEFSFYAKSDPDLVAKRMNKEAGYIAEILALAALQAGYNVLVDGQLQDVLWRVRHFNKLRELYPKLRIALLHVIAPLDVIQERIDEKAKVTGFNIPLEHTQALIDAMPENIDIVRPEVDYFCTIKNAGGGRDFELMGKTTWEDFTEQFSQEVEVLKSCKKPPEIQNPAEEEVAPKNIPKPTLVRRLASAEETRYAAQSFRARRRSLRKPFRVNLSTEENHKSSEMKFYGMYSHIRETLDYNYHCNYTYERQKFQDAIITEFLHAVVIEDSQGQMCTTPTEPWLVFTAGAMGAGKSYTMRKLVENGHFPLIAFITVDPDQIRRHLPEFHLYCDSNPELAGALTQKEAGYIAEILTLAGLQSGKNVMVDGSLRNTEWYQTYFQRLRKDFPILRLAILHVTAPRDAIFQRAAERAILTGRVVPKHILEEAIEQVPRSIKILGPKTDYFVELQNNPGAPDIELGTEGETFDNFRTKWIQSCAWVPGTKKKQEQLKLRHSSNSLSASSIA